MAFPFWGSRISFHSNQGRKVYLQSNRCIARSSEYYTFTIEGVIIFRWEKGTNTIRYTTLKDANGRLIQYWLLHTFLPVYYLLEEKYQMLHVGGVELDGKACFFAAPSFGGKSTLTHYFLQQGHRLLSDDTLGVYKKGKQYYAVPSYPYIRNYRKIEDLGSPVENFSRQSMPIGRIYRLVQVGSNSDISIRKTRGIEKFSVVEMCRDIKFPIAKEEHLEAWIDFTRNIPIYEIMIPQDQNRLEEVYQAIIKHTNSIPVGNPGTTEPIPQS